MPDWNTQKGITVPDATPTGVAGAYLKDNFVGLRNRVVYYTTGTPDANDDNTQGFAAGSRWFDTNAGILWVCVDASTAAADWRSVFQREPGQSLGGPLVLCPGNPASSGSDGGLQLGTGGNARGEGAVDLQSARSDDAQVASGLRSAVIAGENNRALATGSVVLGGNNNQAGAEGAITNISVGNPATVTSMNHGLPSGWNVVNINGSNSTPSIDGERGIEVTGVDTFNVWANVTNAGNAGFWETGNHALVAGGQDNRAIGPRSFVAGGYFNTASGAASRAEGIFTLANGVGSHAEGQNTTASGDSSHAEGTWAFAYGHFAHAEGLFTNATGQSSHVEGGNSLAFGWSSHAEGYNTWANGNFSHTEGRQTTANGHSSHAGGDQSKAHLHSQWARASGGHSSQFGTAQTTITHLFRRTTNVTATELTLGGGTPSSTTRFTILDGQTLACIVNIVGRRENGGANDHAMFVRHVLIRREASTTSLVGSVQTVSTDINPAGWGGVTITADDTNESLKIDVTGAASTNIRWTATIFASEAADAAI